MIEAHDAMLAAHEARHPMPVELVRALADGFGVPPERARAAVDEDYRVLLDARDRSLRLQRRYRAVRAALRGGQVGNRPDE